MRHFALLLLFAFPGCQCLQPVGEDRDAGAGDAGVDAGTTIPPECVQARDCVPVTPPRDCAFGGPSASRSCIDGTCVFDCQGARTCSMQLGSCLSCDAGVPTCNAASCGLVNDGAAGRIYRTCSPGASDNLGTFVARKRADTACDLDVFLGDGGMFGELELGGDQLSASAEVYEEPQVTCTVRGLATALNRVELGCARCFYLLEWP
jgi:hypothetical protein